MRSAYGCPKITVHETFLKVARGVEAAQEMPDCHPSADAEQQLSPQADYDGDRPASCPLPMQMKLSLAYRWRPERMQAEPPDTIIQPALEDTDDQMILRRQALHKAQTVGKSEGWWNGFQMIP